MAIIRFLAPCVLAALPIVTVAAPADADRHFSDEVFFDTSLAPASYPYSGGQATGGSALALVDRRLPVTRAHVVSGPNALRLA